MKIGQGMRARFGKPAAAPEADSALYISVSDLGWHTTLQRPGEPRQHNLSNETEGAGATAFSPLHMLRQAVRAVTPSQREQIGRVYLLVTDPGIALADNRLNRVRVTDPSAIRQAGAQELGSAGAVYGFQPYGVAGEQEAERGVFAFMPEVLARDYIGGLDSLAVKLVQLVPAQFIRMRQVAERPFISLTIGSASSDLVIGDPESGALASRVLPVGSQTFAKALADATSMPIQQAVEGLARRNCLPATRDPGSSVPVTGTERALRPLMDLLKTELLASLDYMRFQRLGETPDVLLLDGNADAIRGLEGWLTQLLPVELRRGTGIHASFVASPAERSANMLEGSAKGLLKIGKREYRFEGGRFVTDQANGRPPPRRSVDTPRRAAPAWREWFAELDTRRLAVPAGIALLGIGAILTTMGQSSAARQAGVAALSDAMGEDATLRSALNRRLAENANRRPEPLFLTEKLVALARNLPDAVWLTHVATVNEGPASPRDTRLLVDGVVGMDNPDYLGRINAFMDRLGSDPSFMAGVASVALSNAAGTPGPDGHFTFTVTVVLKPVAAQAVRRS